MKWNPNKSSGKTSGDILEHIKFARGDSPAYRFIIIRDTREQQPWGFPEFEVEDKGLKTGDYTIGFRYERQLRKLDKIFVVERKATASELLSMVGQERDRWQDELARLKRIAHPFVIVECSLREFLEQAVMSGVNPTSAFGSVVAWQKYFPLIWAENRTLAKEHFLVLARMFWRKYILGHRRGEGK